MRQLTSKQKKLLAKWSNESITRNQDKLYDWDDLTYQQQEELEKINNTEILWQEVSRFLRDNNF
jgi:hypothetical protein